MPKFLEIKFDPPIFVYNTKPHGLLLPLKGAQALWWYYVTVLAQLKDADENLVLEGEEDKVVLYESLFRKAAEMYDVDINELSNFWPLVDVEAARLNSLRAEDKAQGGFYIELAKEYRFEGSLTVRSKH